MTTTHWLIVIAVILTVQEWLTRRRERRNAEQIEAAVKGVIEVWADKQYQQLHGISLQIEELKRPTIPPGECGPVPSSVHEELVRHPYPPPGPGSFVRKPGLFSEESGVVPIKKGD